MKKIIKQIDTLKCSKCGTYAANFLVKEGLCQTCKFKKENENVPTKTKN